MRGNWTNPAADALLRDIIAWTRAAGSTSGQLGQMVLNHGGFVPLLEKRGSLKPETEDLIRAFMTTFPDRGTLPASLAQKLKSEARCHNPWSPERHRSMMIRLGYPDHPSLSPMSNLSGAAQQKIAEAKAVRAAPTDPGKPRVSAAVIRAAKVDGRDLPAFVTALIDMGAGVLARRSRDEWRGDIMSSVNKVILIGNLGADPEARSFQNGGEIVNMRIATSERWKDRQTGEQKERTEWHSIVITNDGLVKVAKQYLRKGSKVYVEGQLRTRKWQDQQGVDRWSTEIQVGAFNGNLTLLDKAPSDSGRHDYSSYDQTPGAGAGDAPKRDDLDDDVPF